MTDPSALPASPTTTRCRRWPSAAASGSGWASGGRGRCCASSAIPNGPCAARSSAGPTARAASWPSPIPRCEPPATGSGPRPSRTWSPTASGSRSTAGRSPPDDFARLVERVLVVADRVAPRHGEPTEFELLTAVVFARFAEVRPDLALVEVGLGGRLDATHAWDGGVAVVTNVDLDHMDRLGDTIPLIAREKAAIIERGDLAVTGARGDGLAVIRRRARRVAVPLTEVEPPPLLGWDRDGHRHRAAAARAGPGSACAGGTRRRTRRSPMRRSMRSRRPGSRPSPTTPGGAATRTPSGRAGWSSSGSSDRDVLLDGAHNPAGAAALALALDDLRPFLDGGPLDARDRVDGRQGRRRRRRRARARRRRWPARPSCATTLDVAARACPAADLAARWRTGAACGRAGRPAAPVIARRSAAPRPGVRRIGPGRRRRFALSCRRGAWRPRRRPGRCATPTPPEDSMTDPRPPPPRADRGSAPTRSAGASGRS